MYARHGHFHRAHAGDDRPGLGVAVADDPPMAILIEQVGVVSDPDGDLCFHRLGEQLSRPLLQNLGQRVRSGLIGKCKRLGSLRRLGSLAVPELVEALVEYSPENPGTERRVWICRLLGEGGNPEGIQALQAHRSDPDPDVARCAARFIRN